MKKGFTRWALAALLVLGGGSARAQGTFVHPGLMHSEQDFERIREGLAKNDPQVVAAYNVLRTCWVANKGVTDVWWITDWIKRGIAGDENYMNAYRNAAKAYQCAVLWKITGEKEWADRALYILNTYADVTVALGGNTNISLIPAFIGYQFANAAELMRDCEYWDPKDFEDFKQWMIDVWFTVAQDFLERRHDTVVREGNWYHYHSNWGVGNALFCISLGVLCDLPDIYNYGMYWVKEGPGNESLFVSPELCGSGWGLVPWMHEDERGPLGYLNQMQESGRDQGHAMAALGQTSYWMQTAYNQGDNAFCNVNNSMIAGAAEYVAMFNSLDNNIPEEAAEIATIPYKQNWWMGGLGWTGQGQHRPIWQLFINHYENRMGIPMRYCKRMKAKLGIESGGNNAYGVNSGGFDHTGYGDLLHYNKPVTEAERPTVLSPQITYNGYQRPFAEMRNVKPGTQLTLTALLPEGTTDTGNWEWEDGVTGPSRTITADKSGLWRVTYTNENGIKSTQMFCISVYGEGIIASYTPWVSYGGVRTDRQSTVYAVSGKEVTLGFDYANWNFIEKIEWFNAAGQKVAEGGSYTFTQGTADRKLTVRLTNESGVTLEQEFNVINLVVEPKLYVDDELVDGSSVLVPAGTKVVMRADPTTNRYNNGTFQWSSGETDDCLTFENLQESVYRTLEWSKKLGTSSFQATLNFDVKVFSNDRVLEDGYYFFTDKSTGLYLNNTTLKFENMDADAATTDYVWKLVWYDTYKRYKIESYDGLRFIDYQGTFQSATFLARKNTYEISVLTGSEDNDCFIQNGPQADGFYWTISNNLLEAKTQKQRPSAFPFSLLPYNPESVDVEQLPVREEAIRIERVGDDVQIEMPADGRVSIYSLAGGLRRIVDLKAGVNRIETNQLPHGLFMVNVVCPTATRTVKYIR